MTANINICASVNKDLGFKWKVFILEQTYTDVVSSMQILGFNYYIIFLITYSYRQISFLIRGIYTLAIKIKRYGRN